MTSQMALMNNLSVALATDSAVSWRMGDLAGPVYNTSEKIYQLAGRQPIGYMNYFSGDFMGISWDRIFGMYREHLEGEGSKDEEKFGRKEFGEVTSDDPDNPGYVEHFLNFLDESPLLNKKELQIDSMATEVAGFLRLKIPSMRDLRDSLLSEQSDIRWKEDEELLALRDEMRGLSPQIHEEIGMLVQVMTEESDEEPKRKHESLEDSEPELLQALVSKVARLMKTPVSQFPREFVEDLARFGGLYLANDWRDPEMRFSGITIAGFGGEEEVPRVVEIKIWEKWNGKMRYEIEEVHNAPAIVRLAQTERITAILGGLSVVAEQELIGSIAEEFSDFIPYVIKHTKGIGPVGEKAIVAVIDREARAFAEVILGKVKNKMDVNKQSISPSDINRLSPLDLARFAEKLVDMEATSQYVRFAGNAGVGGPVDVVSITKEDGLVWIKRKDVIEERLNPRIYRTPRARGRHI